jgi:hypothetical protein
MSVYIQHDAEIVVPSAFSTHECTHAHLGHAYLHHDRKSPRHVEEMQAEQWAHEKMRENGIPVPRSQTKRAKAHVTRKVDGAISRGAKHINPAARKFADMSVEEVADAKAKAKAKQMKSEEKRCSVIIIIAGDRS